jgi:hypothetical protein
MTRVAGYTEPHHEVVARIFVPLSMADGGYLTWSGAARSLGIDLTATTRWDELADAARARGVDIGVPQQGCIDERTVKDLIGVIRDRTRRPDVTHYALWEGYAGEIDSSLREQSEPIPAGEGHYLRNGSFRLFTSDLAWARSRSRERGYRFPVAVWPHDKAFTLASWLYQDSYYLSSDRETLALLQAAGLDALQIAREDLLPSTGD